MQADACLTRQIAAQQSPAICTHAPRSARQPLAADTPALAITCFRTARAAWDTIITTGIASIRDGAPQTIATIAAMELKHDLIASLTQCDRMHEPAQVTGAQSQTHIQRQSPAARPRPQGWPVCG